MIYLISGSPRAGKSTLSRNLAKKLNIGYLSTDNIRPILWALYKGKEKNAKFPFEKMFQVDKMDEFYNKYSPAEIFKADIVEAKTIWIGASELIDYLLLCNMDYILEGVHLLPRYLKKYKDNKNVKIIYLVKCIGEEIYDGLLKNKGGKHNDWLADNIKSDEVLRTAAESLAVYGKYFVKECAMFGLECVNTEEDFVQELKLAEKKLIG